MTTQHTHGPWHWEEGTPAITRRWNGKECVIATVDYRTLAWHEDSNCAGRESGANARLIAAAPELLAIAEKLVEDGLSTSLVKEARTAIAKATGEQP